MYFDKVNLLQIHSIVDISDTHDRPEKRNERSDGQNEFVNVIRQIGQICQIQKNYLIIYLITIDCLHLLILIDYELLNLLIWKSITLGVERKTVS